MDQPRAKGLKVGSWESGGGGVGGVERRARKKSCLPDGFAVTQLPGGRRSLEICDLSAESPSAPARQSRSPRAQLARAGR